VPRKTALRWRFAYEWHDDSGALVSQLRQRELGIRRRRADGAPRIASINEQRESPKPSGNTIGRSGRRPDDHPGLSEASGSSVTAAPRVHLA